MSGRSPGRHAHGGTGLGPGVVPTATAGKPSISVPGVELGALLDDGSGADHAAGADPAPVTDDRAGLDDRSGADAAAVDHGAGTDHHAVGDHEIVVGKQVEHGVLEDLHVVADAYRPVRVADDLHAGPDDRALAHDDVAGDLRGREERRGRSDGRRDAPKA